MKIITTETRRTRRIQNGRAEELQNSRNSILFLILTTVLLLFSELYVSPWRIILDNLMPRCLNSQKLFCCFAHGGCVWFDACPSAQCEGGLFDVELHAVDDAAAAFGCLAGEPSP
jgi:hypothetical protein